MASGASSFFEGNIFLLFHLFSNGPLANDIVPGSGALFVAYNYDFAFKNFSVVLFLVANTFYSVEMARGF